MKKPLIDNYVEIVVHDKSKKSFTISRDIAKKIISLLTTHQITSDNDRIPADKVFEKLHKKYGKIGATLRGYRSRDSMTQKELATQLEIPQGHISAMEHSKRPIGKKMAQRLAKIFKTDYRLFL